MSGFRNRVGDSSNQKTKRGKKMKKFYSHLAGNTKNCHEKIERKLKKKGAKLVRSADKCDVVIVFCPIVSRVESDIVSALSELKLEDTQSPKAILVAMHHTHSTDYVVPPKSQHSLEDGESVPVVHCLFHETKGLLKCPLNKQAVKTIRQHMGLKRRSNPCSTQ